MLRYYGRYLSFVFRGRSQPLLARGFSAVYVSLEAGVQHSRTNGANNTVLHIELVAVRQLHRSFVPSCRLPY